MNGMGVACECGREQLVPVELVEDAADPKRAIVDYLAERGWAYSFALQAEGCEPWRCPRCIAATQRVAK